MNVRDMIAGKKSMPMKCGMDFLSYRIGKARAGGGGEIASFWGYIDSNPSYFSELKQTAGWGAMTDSEKTEAYNNYVSSLPASAVGDTGYLLYYPNCTYSLWLSDANKARYVTVSNLSYGSLVGSTQTIYLSIGVKSNEVVVAPVTGYYQEICVWDGVSQPSTCSTAVISAGSTVATANHTIGATFMNDGMSGSFNFPWSWYYKITPSDVNVVSTNYPATSRPAGLVNNCTITSTVTNEDNSTTTNNYNLTVPIIDETTLVFTDPATSTTTTMSNWWYDYSTRTYHLTDASSNEHTVCYGDDKLTIVSGGATTEYSYMA